MRLEALLQCLETLQADLAKEALERPGRDLFDYGRAVGMYAGVEQAKITLVDMVREREEKGFDL